MSDPVKEAVERLEDDLSRAREDGLVLTDAPRLRTVLTELSRLSRLVEEAGEALDLIERKAEAAVRELAGGHPFDAMACLDEIDTISFAAAQATWEGRPPKPPRRRASLTHKAISGGGE